jgi:hypothetical protein
LLKKEKQVAIDVDEVRRNMKKSWRGKDMTMQVATVAISNSGSWMCLKIRCCPVGKFREWDFQSEAIQHPRVKV